MHRKQKLEQVSLLYKKHYHRLYTYAVAFLSNEEEAKDIVNDVFEAVWKNTSESYDETSFTVYAYKMIRSRSLDRLRHQKVEQRYFKLSRATDILHNDDDVREFEERIEKLREAVDRLPEQGKTILEYCYFKKLTYQQTADELNLSVHTVHKTMTRMFARLREMLKNDK